MTLLTLVQSACDILSISRPSSVISAADQTTRTLLSCAQREGKALARRWTWQALTKTHTFTSIAAERQTTGVPSDFDRMLSNSMFNQTRKRHVTGPLTGQEWEAHEALTSQLLFDAWRMRETQLDLKPIPSAGDTYAYAYVSSDWAHDEGWTVYRDAFAADSDAALLDEELMTYGVIWRFKQSRGLQFDDDFGLYEQQVKQAMARDGSRRVISLGGVDDDALRPRYPGVPEGSWPLP